MKVPRRLQPLVEEGVIDEVVRQLMSGKEAMVFVVRCGGEARCAKVYKEADRRSFRQAVDYIENRKTKNSRQARAMAKGTRYGREAQERAWQSAEVDALYRLAAAGVRVPRPYNFHEGVLLMELVTDAEGNAAPRLNDVELSPEEARDFHGRLIAEVVRMLCAGVIHGDLSEFNILPAKQSAPLGKVTFVLTNKGKMAHEFVVVKTAKPAGSLLKGKEADETGAAGEEGDIQPGQTKKLVLTLKRGHYALICNLPGHYLGGQFADFYVH